MPEPTSTENTENPDVQQNEADQPIQLGTAEGGPPPPSAGGPSEGDGPSHWVNGIPALGPSTAVQAVYQNDHIRRVMQRISGPVDAPNVDDLPIFTLDDILGKDPTPFTKVLEEGPGENRENLKRLLETQGLTEADLEAHKAQQQQESSNPFEMRGMSGRGGMMELQRGRGRRIPSSIPFQPGQNMPMMPIPGTGGGLNMTSSVPQVNYGPTSGTNGGPVTNGLLGVGRGGGGTATSGPLVPSSAGRGTPRMPNTGELQRFGGSPGMRASPGMEGPMGMPSGYPGMGAMQGLNPGGSLDIDGGGEAGIRQLILNETELATNCTDSLGQGLNTFILLDNSMSMSAESFQQANEVLEDFLQGLEDNSMDFGLEENVSLITLGGSQATVEQYLTNEYQCLRTRLASLQILGPNHLAHALLLVIGGLERAYEMIIGRHSISSRILLVSNGGFAITSSGGASQSISEAIELLQNVLKQHHMKLYFVPVGNANSSFKTIMQSFPGAKVVEASDMNIVTRTHIHHRIAGSMTENAGIGNVTRELVQEIASAHFPDLVVGDRDINIIMELLHEDQQYELQRQERRQQGARNGGGGGAGMGGRGLASLGGGMMPGMGGGGLPNMGGMMPSLGGGMMPGMGGGGLPSMGGMMPRMGGGMMPGVGGGGLPSMGGMMPRMGGGMMPGMGGGGLPNMGGMMPRMGGGMMPGMGGGGLPSMGGMMPRMGGGMTPGMGGGGGSLGASRGGGGMGNPQGMQGVPGSALSGISGRGGMTNHMNGQTLAPRSSGVNLGTRPRLP